MLSRGLLALLPLLVCAAPAKASCERDRGGPPVTIRLIDRVERGGDRDITRLVACDRHHGRATVLARGRVDQPIFRDLRGSTIGSASVAGRRVAWVKARGGAAGPSCASTSSASVRECAGWRRCASSAGGQGPVSLRSAP